MSEKDRQLLSKIRKHLNELHTAWRNDPYFDGHHKSNEGYVGLSLAYPNWFEADNYLTDEPEVYAVEVYSYLFGPNRLHHYKDLQEAWDAVRHWKYQAEEEGSDNAE